MEDEVNARVRMSNKGQIVVPKSIRDSHGWGPGDEFELMPSGSGVTLMPVRDGTPLFPKTTIEEFLRNRIRIDRPFPDDEEIDRALLGEAARRFREERG